MPKTQNDCAQEFRQALLEFENKLDQIDEDTPWSETEPKWWVRMMTIRSTVHATREEFGYTKGRS